jgi:hypothetical protein
VEDPSVPVVSLNWSWRGGSAFDPIGHEGMMALAAAMLSEGAGALDNLAFADAARAEGRVHTGRGGVGQFDVGHVGGGGEFDAGGIADSGAGFCLIKDGRRGGY